MIPGRRSAGAFTRRAPLPILFFFVFAASGCKKQEHKPVAGLLAAGAPVMLETSDGPRPIAVGSQLLPSDRVRATGPAAIEFFGGALRFLEKGDALEVGDASESKLLGPNLTAKVLEAGVISELPIQQRLIAARYHSVAFTPATVGQDTALQTSDYFKAFFTPNGIEKLQNAPAPDGPRRLPPPPDRVKVPHVHAGDLGDGAGQVEVTDGFVIAESDALATAVLLEDQVYALGHTSRLVLPEDAEITLTTAEGRQIELEGPLDLLLR